MNNTKPVETIFDSRDIIAYCHYFGGMPFSICGVPRREQPVHKGWSPRDNYKFCPIDGLKTCPKCMAKGNV